MDLLNLINNSSEEEISSIVDTVLKNAIETSEQGKELGFSENMSSVSKFTAHKGFIHPNTRIKYSNRAAYSYSMKTTDYIYDFARYVKKININDRSSLVKYIEKYINSYFGIISDGIDRRDTYFNQMAFDTTTTDEELFEKIANLEIGDLKGKNVAMCTEKAAMAQNLLSLFGFEVYYCMGCVNNNGKEEAHCFNIARAKDTYRLLDYSIPVTVFSNSNAVDYAPFQGDIELNEIEDVLLNGINKEFFSYEYIKTPHGIKKMETGEIRIYNVGSMRLEQTKPQNR